VLTLINDNLAWPGASSSRQEQKTGQEPLESVSHHRSVGHVPGLAGIIQRIPDQPGLKGRAVEAISIATAIKDTQMDVEEQDVEQDRPHDQGDGPAGHLLYGLHDGLSQIAKDEPQFGGRVQTHQQHHKQTHKLNAYRAG